ncbi:putative membrane protein DUF2339 [Pseudonocardia endophytica]|uniref:Putative membrane protein DUF2339 n=1 Tax=Pseudonocardia endophytica TaxID=401976 RepID=A0A4R1I1B7_PSEEN|nr:putative membrane protein DUF2339 [Pseudonocardia endophytica]
MPPPYPAYPPPGAWAPAPGRPPGTAPGAPTVPGGRPVPPPAPRRPTDWSRLPVWAGAAVTFVGVVLLLVLAASADWFGPTARVLAGAGLGVVLIGLAAWLVRRGGRSGAGPSALAGTGTTALFGSVVAATTLYELVPAPVGLVLCLVVAAAGIALADRWDSTGFALAVLVGVEMALLVVSGHLDLLSFAMTVVVQIGVAPTALRRAPALAPVAAAGTALHAMLAGPLVTSEVDGVAMPGLLLAVAGFALVLGVGVAVLGALRGVRGSAAGGVGRTRTPSVIGIVFAPVPLLATLPGVGTVTAVVTTFAAAAVTAGAAHPRTGRAVRIAAVTVASLLVAAATIRWLNGVTLSGVLLAEALVLLVTAAFLRSRPVQLAGAVLATVGGVAALGTALDPSSLAEPSRVPSVDLPPGSLVVAALLAAVAMAGLAAALRTDTPPAAQWAAWAWLPVATGLYGVSWLVVAAAQLVVPGENGFLSGHVLVTLGITGLGVVLLVRGLQRPAAGRTGFALIVAALVKLVVFDLVTLDGLARVAAFIGAGLVLLAVGTWYARRAAPAAPGGPSAPGSPAAPGGVATPGGPAAPTGPGAGRPATPTRPGADSSGPADPGANPTGDAP